MRFTLLLLVALTVAANAASVDTAPGGRWVEAVLTAYSPLDDFTRDDVNNPQRLTATGAKTESVPYNVAADPRTLPFGSRIYIPTGLGYLDESRPSARSFIVDDTGSVVRRKTRRSGILHLDLRFKSVESAVMFGTKKALVFIYE